MKLIIFGIVVSTGLLGCSKHYIDPTFQPYVDGFVRDGGLTVVAPLNIHFADLDPSAEIGDCRRDSTGPIEIAIDQKSWANLTEVERTLVMYHELGHCILGRDHNSQLDSRGYPISVMYPSAQTASRPFTESRPTLLHELFHSA